MTNASLFLFCGGPAIYADGRPKPLMKVREGCSLILFFLRYLERHRAEMPESITLLCDDGHESDLTAELADFNYPVPIYIQACGQSPNTFEKCKRALCGIKNRNSVVQFGYPDVFFFGEYSQPSDEDLERKSSVYISAAALTSRFPRLIVDIYNNKVKGISDYTSMVPANPLYVFGGDLWAKVEELQVLMDQFQSENIGAPPSLEYDFFFWLINQEKINSVMLYGDRLWVDSPRDINNLLSRTNEVI